MSPTLRTCALLLGVTFAGCATTRPPPPVMTSAPPPGAVDNGQPRMQAALDALGHANADLSAAAANKGGHRAAGLALIGQAAAEVQAGMQYAATHPREIGAEEGAARPLPVDVDVPGARRQPKMWRAMLDLREARKQLWYAASDKGGHRARAIALIDQAMEQVRAGIDFANGRR